MLAIRRALSLYKSVHLFLMFTTLSQAKQHLNIDQDFKDDDQLIISYIQMSEDAIAKYLDRNLEDCLKFGKLEPSIQSAILLMIGNLYANREAVSFSKSPTELPYSIKFLVMLNRRFSIG